MEDCLHFFTNFQMVFVYLVRNYGWGRRKIEPPKILDWFDTLSSQLMNFSQCMLHGKDWRRDRLPGTFKRHAALASFSASEETLPSLLLTSFVPQNLSSIVLSFLTRSPLIGVSNFFSFSDELPIGSVDRSAAEGRYKYVNRTQLKTENTDAADNILLEYESTSSLDIDSRSRLTSTSVSWLFMEDVWRAELSLRVLVSSSQELLSLPSHASPARYLSITTETYNFTKSEQRLGCSVNLLTQLCNTYV